MAETTILMRPASFGADFIVIDLMPPTPFLLLNLKEVPFEYLVWHLPYAVMPLGEALEQLEVFATKVMPEFGMEPPAPPKVHGPNVAPTGMSIGA